MKINRKQMIRLWLRYLLVYPGAPPLGDVAEADVIIVQAFGRNSFSDRVLHNIGKLYNDCCNDDLLTIRQLHYNNFQPGLPNLSLANECRVLMENFNKPAIVQWEVAAAFEFEWYKKNSHRIFCVWPPDRPVKRFSTWQVKEKTREIMDRYGWKIPVELAHKRQYIRAFFTVYKLIGPAVIPPQNTDCYDPLSVQKWTSSPFRWFIPYEPIARIYFLMLLLK